MNYGTIDRINEDGVIFSVAYKEGDKDVAFKRLTTTQGGNLTFVSSTQDGVTVEDGSEMVLTSKNILDEGTATSIRDAMVNTYVNYTDGVGRPEQKGNGYTPVYVASNGKAVACSILKEPTTAAAGSAGIVSVKGAPELETYQKDPAGGSETISRPAFLSSLTETDACWVKPVDLAEITGFVNSLFPKTQS